jgi:hypothetical protein
LGQARERGLYSTTSRRCGKIAAGRSDHKGRDVMLFGLSLSALLAMELQPEAHAPCSCGGVTFLSLSIPSLLFLGFLLYLLVKLLRRRRKGKAAERKERSELDRWMDETLARELQRKLGIDWEIVMRALQGTPEPDAVGAIEEAVRSVQVKYARTADGSVEARLEVSFEDGSTATASRTLESAEIPKGILDELARTGGAFVFRPVHFPWSGPDRGWS